MVLAVDIGQTVESAFAEFFAWLPNLLAALAILVIGYFVAKLVGTLVSRVLHRVGLDRTLTKGGVGAWISRVTESPSHLLGALTFWVLFLGAVSLAVTALGIDALTEFVAAIYGYLPNVIAAVAIFVVATAIAAGVGALAARAMGDTPTGKVVGTVGPALVMLIAVFMILDQLKIAEEIVTITYAALVGAFALAAALAFGLGGRGVAGRMLEDAYRKGQEQRDQVKRDLETGKERARDEAERMREEAGVTAAGDTVAGPRSRAHEPATRPTEQATRAPTEPEPPAATEPATAEPRAGARRKR